MSHSDSKLPSTLPPPSGVRRKLIADLKVGLVLLAEVRATDEEAEQQAQAETSEPEELLNCGKRGVA